MMNVYKRILVAVDVSTEAEQVLEAALDLATINDAQVSVLHVAQNIAAAYGQWITYIPPVNTSEVRDQVYANVAERVAKVGIDASSIDVEFGLPVDTIVAKAKHNRDDLIVIGSHGRHGVRLLLGSTANGVLHHADCDVFAVRIKD